jgi:threonine synthase
VPTNTPSMDIEISSNFERYLFDLFGRDSAKLAQVMNSFKQDRSFAVTAEDLQNARSNFAAYRADEDEVLDTIRALYKETGYVLDPHTAVGARAAQHVKTDGAIVVLATAHPAKFPDAVKSATGEHPALPAHLSGLFDKDERLNTLPNDLATVQKFVRDHARIIKAV